jgi:hypothetical protein
VLECISIAHGGEIKCSRLSISEQLNSKLLSFIVFSKFEKLLICALPAFWSMVFCSILRSRGRCLQ